MNELSIIIPCVSTIDTLPGFVDQLAVHLMSNPSEIDVIVVQKEIEDLETELATVRNKMSKLLKEVAE